MLCLAFLAKLFPACLLLAQVLVDLAAVPQVERDRAVNQRRSAFPRFLSVFLLPAVALNSRP